MLLYRPAKQDDFDYFLTQDPAFSNPHCVSNLLQQLGIQHTKIPSLVQQLHELVTQYIVCEVVCLAVIIKAVLVSLTMNIMMY